MVELRYAKIIQDYPDYAPRRMRIGDVWVYNPTGEQLAGEGWLPVIESEPPETDAQHYAVQRWAEENGQIVQTWELAELPDEVTPEEIAAAIEEAMT